MSGIQAGELALEPLESVERAIADDAAVQHFEAPRRVVVQNRLQHLRIGMRAAERARIAEAEHAR